MNATVTPRALQRVIESMATSDGAGVKLLRTLGSRQGARLDPFLMLDHFSSDNPGDYIAGFPAHPQRGFETVTYMLDGHKRHEDHLGNDAAFAIPPHPDDKSLTRPLHGVTLLRRRPPHPPHRRDLSPEGRGGEP